MAIEFKPGTHIRSRAIGRKGVIVSSLDDEWKAKGLVRVRWVDHWSPSSPGAIVHPDSLVLDDEDEPRRDEPPPPDVTARRGVVMDDELWVNGRRKQRY